MVQMCGLVTEHSAVQAALCMVLSLGCFKETTCVDDAVTRFRDGYLTGELWDVLVLEVGKELQQVVKILAATGKRHVPSDLGVRLHEGLYMHQGNEGWINGWLLWL